MAEINFELNFSHFENNTTLDNSHYTGLTTQKSTHKYRETDRLVLCDYFFAVILVPFNRV